MEMTVVISTTVHVLKKLTSQELPFPTDRSHSRQSGDDSSMSNDWFFRKTFFCHNSKVFRFVLCIKMTLNMRQMSLSVMPRNEKHQLWTHHHKSAHLAKSKLVIVFKITTPSLIPFQTRIYSLELTLGFLFVKIFWI